MMRAERAEDKVVARELPEAWREEGAGSSSISGSR